MIHSICNEVANTACLTHNCLREHFVSREFLTALLCGNSVAFIEHCDFLQLFPTINFYMATQILSSMTLKNISEHLPENIRGLKDALVFMPPLEEAMLDSFIKLFTVHCGLERTLLSKSRVEQMKKDMVEEGKDKNVRGEIREVEDQDWERQRTIEDYDQPQREYCSDSYIYPSEYVNDKNMPRSTSHDNYTNNSNEDRYSFVPYEERYETLSARHQPHQPQRHDNQHNEDYYEAEGEQGFYHQPQNSSDEIIPRDDVYYIEGSSTDIIDEIPHNQNYCLHNNDYSNEELLKIQEHQNQNQFQQQLHHQQNQQNFHKISNSNQSGRIQDPRTFHEQKRY